jgi:ATP/maltotriose-dependent transcriptional regulator MalT
MQQAVTADSTVLQGDIAVLRSAIAYFRGDIRQALEQGTAALRFLPASRIDERVHMGMTLGYFYWQKGNFKDARPLLEEAYESGKKIGSYYHAVTSLCVLTQMEVHQGKLQQAFRRHQEAIELAGVSPAALGAHQVLGIILYEINDLKMALNHIQLSIDSSQIMRQPDVLARNPRPEGCVQPGSRRQSGIGGSLRSPA